MASKQGGGKKQRKRKGGKSSQQEEKQQAQPARPPQQQQQAQQQKGGKKKGAQKEQQKGGQKKGQQQQQQQQQKQQQQKQKGGPKAGPKGGPKGGKGGAQKGQQQQQQKGAKQQQQKGGKKQKEKVSSKDGRKRKQPTKKAIDLAQARLDLIIRSKYQNPGKPSPSLLEQKICQYLVDLEASSKDLREHLRDLGIHSAREINVTQTKKAIVIFVPFPQHSRWQKLQDRLVRELEKKFPDKDVLVIAQRKVMKLCQINPKINAPRPRTQTITAVQSEILNDVVFPTKIVGKRTRFRVGGKRLLKVYLDPKDSKDIESRLPTFESVYRKLTRKNIKFLFPRYVI